MNKQNFPQPEQWVDEFGDDLYRYAYSRLKDSHLAEDMVQETLVSALRSLQNYSEQSSLKNWLLGILKHKIMDHFRRTYKEKHIHILSEDDSAFLNHHFDSWEHWSPKPSMWWHPRKALQEKEFWDTLQKCLDHMPSHMRHAFVLRVLDNNKTEDVRTTMNVSETNLGVILHRARLQLRRCLETNWFQRGKGNK